METRRIEEYLYPLAELAELKAKVTEALDDENLSNLSVIKRPEPDSLYELMRQFNYPQPPEGRKT